MNTMYYPRNKYFSRCKEAFNFETWKIFLRNLDA